MINQIHAKFYRPERGWDPIPPEHAAAHALHEWQLAETGTVARDLDALEAATGRLAGKRVLDLGGGPGQYSVAMAQRGAHVVWHDISLAYRDFVSEKAREHGVTVETSLGYLEEAVKFADRPFDLVFNRICWRYCMSDRPFATVIHSLVKPGGYAFIQEEYDEGITGGKRKWLIDFYGKTGIKIGHLFPLRGVIEREMGRFPHSTFVVDYEKHRNCCDVLYGKPAEKSSESRP